MDVRDNRHMGQAVVTRRGALALLVLTLTVPGGSSTAAVRLPTVVRPQTLLRVSSFIRGFAQDGSRIAWLTGSDTHRCTRTLHVRSLRTRLMQTSLQTGCTRNPEYVSSLALAGSAAAWDSFVARDKNGFWATMLTARVPERRVHRIGSIQGIHADGYPDSYPTSAGAGNLLVYSTQEGVRRIAGGKARRFFYFPKPLGLAVGAGRVAVVRQEFRPGDGCGCVSSPDWRADGKIGFLSELAPPPQGKKVVTLIDPSGSARTVLIDDGLWRMGLDWSLDGTKLAYSYTGTGFGIAVADADGSGAHDVTPGDDPALSPNGSKVAFDRYNGSFYIFVANADGSDEHLVGAGYDPAWSPDGTRLAFSVNGQLAVSNADGSGFHQLGLPGSNSQWSPDGTKLAYNNDGIWVAGADGSNPRRLTMYVHDFDPHWSPDGRTLVFESNRNDFFPKDHEGLFEPELYIVNADGKGLRPVTFTVPASWATIGEIRSAAGRRVSSFEAPGASAGVALAGGRVAVGTQDLAGQGLLTLFAATTGRRLASARLPGPAAEVVGANDRWVIFRTGTRTIRAFDMRTSKARILAIARAAPIGLSVTGRRVAWAENTGLSARVRALTLPG
jgi:WD40-like Beta Propeller Repeat